MAISKILDFSAGSKFAIKLPQDIRYDRKSQNCDWVLFSVTPLLNLAESLVPGALNQGVNHAEILFLLLALCQMNEPVNGLHHTFTFDGDFYATVDQL